jgi:50S ribosome-binding GTPase
MFLNIAIVGAKNVGKSTLFNSLLAEPYADKSETKEEIVQQAPSLYDFVPLPNDMQYCIHDINNLDYLKNNSYKFDIIIYVVDINSTTDTFNDSLKLIIACINSNRTTYDIYNYLYILLNRCDDMLIEDNKFQLLDRHKTMLGHCVKTITTYIGADSKIDYALILTSIEDWYILRTIQSGTTQVLSTKNKNRLNSTFGGKPADSNEKILELLRCAGFLKFKNNFASVIDEHGCSFYQNHIKYQLTNFAIGHNIEENLIRLDEHYDTLTYYAMPTNVVTTAFSDYCETYIDWVCSKWKILDRMRIFSSVSLINKLSKRYNIMTKIHILNDLFIAYFQAMINLCKLSFIELDDIFEKLQSVLVNPDATLGKYFFAYIQNNDCYIPNLIFNYQEITKFISKYQIPMAEMDILLIIIRKKYQMILMDSIKVQIMNYWSNVSVESAKPDPDETIKSLLGLKHYFVNVTAPHSNGPIYVPFLEKKLLTLIEGSSYKDIVRVIKKIEK